MPQVDGVDCRIFDIAEELYSDDVDYCLAVAAINFLASHNLQGAFRQHMEELLERAIKEDLEENESEDEDEENHS